MLSKRDFVRSNTLGSAKNFWWILDDDCKIIVLRQFNMKSTKQPHETIISSDIIQHLIDLLPNDEWFPLANNVEKLSNGTEVEGIGKILYDQGFNTTDCQTASHLGTIFYQAGIWLYNGKLNGIKFQKNPDVTEWCNHLRKYYTSHF